MILELYLKMLKFLLEDIKDIMKYAKSNYSDKESLDKVKGVIELLKGLLIREKQKSTRFKI